MVWSAYRWNGRTLQYRRQAALSQMPILSLAWNQVTSLIRDRREPTSAIGPMCWSAFDNWKTTSVGLLSSNLSQSSSRGHKKFTGLTIERRGETSNYLLSRGCSYRAEHMRRLNPAGSAAREAIIAAAKFPVVKQGGNSAGKYPFARMSVNTSLLHRAGRHYSVLRPELQNTRAN